MGGERKKMQSSYNRKTDGQRESHSPARQRQQTNQLIFLSAMAIILVIVGWAVWSWIKNMPDPVQQTEPPRVKEYFTEGALAPVREAQTTQQNQINQILGPLDGVGATQSTTTPAPAQ